MALKFEYLIVNFIIQVNYTLSFSEIADLWHFDELVWLLKFEIRFVRGDQYAVALALLDRGNVVLGVLACPNLPLTSINVAHPHSPNNEVGCLFFAEVGRGTYMQPLDGSSTVKVVNDLL